MDKKVLRNISFYHSCSSTWIFPSIILHLDFAPKNPPTPCIPRKLKINASNPGSRFLRSRKLVARFDKSPWRRRGACKSTGGEETINDVGAGGAGGKKTAARREEADHVIIDETNVALPAAIASAPGKKKPRERSKRGPRRLPLGEKQWPPWTPAHFRSRGAHYISELPTKRVSGPSFTSFPFRLASFLPSLNGKTSLSLRGGLDGTGWPLSQPPRLFSLSSSPFQPRLISMALGHRENLLLIISFNNCASLRRWAAAAGIWQNVPLVPTLLKEAVITSRAGFALLCFLLLPDLAALFLKLISLCTN